MYYLYAKLEMYLPEPSEDKSGVLTVYITLDGINAYPFIYLLRALSTTVEALDPADSFLYFTTD